MEVEVGGEHAGRHCSQQEGDDGEDDCGETARAGSHCESGAAHEKRQWRVVRWRSEIIFWQGDRVRKGRERLKRRKASEIVRTRS